MTQPRWLEPLPDAELMRATDGWAIDTKGVPARQLMERAGEGLARAVGKHAPAGRIAVICGKGNNGGDGLVAARLLRQAGRDVDVLAVWPPEWMGEDAQAQVKVLPGPAPVPFHPDSSRRRTRSSMQCSARASRARRATPPTRSSSRSTRRARG